MLNVNSPTVQAMLQNTPQGYGNMPVYFGNSPTVTQTVQPNMVQTPYPSPKEMITQGGQQMVYNPSYFAPRNVVGGYNPGYNAAFAGYSNPYMGFGYSGYGYIQQPIDEDSRDRLEMAEINGLTYDEQLIEDSSILKMMSRIVSKNIGRSEEEAEACAATFEAKCKYPKPEPLERKQYKLMHVQLKLGEEVISEYKPNTDSSNIVQKDYNISVIHIEQMKYMQELSIIQRINRNNSIYDNALERRFDHMDMVDFFNNGAGVLMADNLMKSEYEQRIRGISDLYEPNGFRDRLLKNNQLKSKDQMKAIERFTGRYGVMPDGRPVSPGHDPEIASCFSYNPKTGQYDVTAPNFMSSAIERARNSFMRSIDSN